MSNSNDINYSLINAVRDGNLERTREIINNYGLSYCAGWSNGYVLLRDAAEYNHTSVAELLLINGSNVNSKSSRIKPTNTPLHFAALHGNIRIARLLLDEGANVNALNDYGNTPLYNAVDKNKIEVAELLLKHGAGVNLFDKYNKTPLHNAIRKNSLQIVELLLNYGASANMINGNCGKGFMPLHIAVESGSLEITSLLLRRGAKVDAKGTDNTTPLQIAAQKGYTIISEELLNHGACLHSLTDEGYTPLHFASNQGNDVIIQLFLNKGADIHAGTKRGLTPLHIAAIGGNICAVRILLENGAKVDVEDNGGKTVLYQAIVRGGLLNCHNIVEVELCVEEVLRYNPDINNKSGRNSLKTALSNGVKFNNICMKLINYGFTVNPEEVNNSELLHIVVEKGFFTIIEDLLKNGADVNTLHDSIYNNTGFSLLHRAVKKKYIEIAKLLIVYGADVNAKDKTEKTPLFYAIKNVDLTVTKLLLKNGASIKAYPELLNTSVNLGCIEITEALLQHGADVKARDEYGRTALHYTSIEKDDFLIYLMPSKRDIVINNRGEAAKMLLRSGADVNAQTNHGVTTLHFAVLNGYTKVVKVLLEYNSDVSIVDKNNKTLLHHSAEKGFPEICKMLLDKGVNINSKSKDGSTALIAAIKKGHGDAVKVLLERSAECLTCGVDLNYRDTDGRTALHIACLGKHEGVVETLLRFGSDINILCIHNKLQYIPYRLLGYLKKHELKMKTANMYLVDENVIKILKEDEVFIMECKREILILKSQKVADSNITFYDILAKSTGMLAIHLKNDSLVQVLKSDNYKKEFPNYAILIESNYRKAMEMRGLLDQLDNNCYLFNICPELPYNCTEKILSYLSNTDLRLLLEAYRPL